MSVLQSDVLRVAVVQNGLKNYDFQKDKHFSGSVKLAQAPLRKMNICMLGDAQGHSTKRSKHIVGAKKRGKDRDGALAQAVEEVKIPDDSEPDDMFMGRKLEGLEPDFWEGEKWDTLGFIIQYLWAFGILISLVACAVAVTQYNSGAVDIRETDVFKEALENQVEGDSSFDSDNFQDFPESSEAPPLK